MPCGFSINRRFWAAGRSAVCVGVWSCCLNATASDRCPLFFKVAEELVRSVLDWRRHLSSVGVCLHDYATRRSMMESSSLRHLSASRISFVMLGSGGFACCRIPLTALLTVSACSASSCLMAVSTLAIISVAGMFVGVTAKFSLFLSRAISASLRDLEDKSITQLVLSTYGVSVDDAAVCFSTSTFVCLCWC